MMQPLLPSGCDSSRHLAALVHAPDLHLEPEQRAGIARHALRAGYRRLVEAPGQRAEVHRNRANPAVGLVRLENGNAVTVERSHGGFDQSAREPC